jgi:DNA-binding NarL/FixJ family response regulator
MDQTNASERRPRLLVADDHALIRERVVDLLASSFEVVGVVSDGNELIAVAERLRPDIIVLDITMPGKTGIEAARQLRRTNCSAKLVFLTIHEQAQFVRRCMAEGASGYVVKSRLENDLVPAILDALSGRKFLSPPIKV